LTTNGDVVIISESISEPVSERNGHAANTTPTVRGVYDPRPLYPDSGGAAGGQINTFFGGSMPVLEPWIQARSQTQHSRLTDGSQWLTDGAKCSIIQENLAGRWCERKNANPNCQGKIPSSALCALVIESLDPGGDWIP
jgi:hypothetical protein